MAEQFPVEISVLSAIALEEYIHNMYFPFGAQMSCRLHYRSIHDTYRITADGQEYYFKVYRQGLRSEHEIAAETELIDCLRRNCILTSYPIANKHGEFVASFLLGDAQRHGVLFTTVGDNRFADQQETPALNRRLGESVARIHAIWDAENPQVRRTPLDAETFLHSSVCHIRKFHELYDFDLLFLEDVARKTNDAIGALSQAPGIYGFCHGDIYADNIRLDGEGNPILFDFDFAAKGWRAYDISLYSYGFGLGADKNTLEKRQRRLDAFLQGYQKFMPISDVFLQSIPLFIPFRRIFNIGSLYIAMANIWGDHAALGSTKSDIETLKHWLDLNPVL